MFISQATRSLLLYESIVIFSNFFPTREILLIEYNFRQYETLFRNNINLRESAVLQQLTYDNFVYEKFQSAETLVIYIMFQFSTRHPILPGKTWRHPSYTEKIVRRCEFA